MGHGISLLTELIHAFTFIERWHSQFLLSGAWQQQVCAGVKQTEEQNSGVKLL